MGSNEALVTDLVVPRATKSMTGDCICVGARTETLYLAVTSNHTGRHSDNVA